MSTIAVDFDGVIHAYRNGWQDGSIYDEPVAGAFDALRALMENYAVFIHTTREPTQVSKWMIEKGWTTAISTGTSLTNKFWNHRNLLLVTNFKHPAIMYIDDRAVRFSNWAEALADVHLYEQGQHPINRHRHLLEVQE